MKKNQARVITNETYMDLAKNGAMVFFDFEELRFLSGLNHDNEVEESYFIINGEQPIQITESDMFEFVKINFIYNQDMKSELMNEKIAGLEIITGAKKCPVCKVNELDPNDALNALSRDNKTYICNDCGTAEAFAEFAN